MMSPRSLALLPAVFASACSWLVSGDRVPAVVPIGPVHVAPPPTDLAATTLGSPQGSNAQRPPWAIHRGYAPVLSASDAAALFHAADANVQPRDAIAGSLLACRIDVQFHERKDWALRPDRWAKADLAMWIGFGAGGADDASALAVLGPNQSNTAFFAVPAARLAEGEVLDVLVNDRDRLFATDFIDRVALAFDGSAPLVSKRAVSELVCRVVDESAIAAMLLERAWAADDLLHAWQFGEPDVRAGIEACRAPDGLGGAMFELAAVLAWDDARVIARVQRAAQVEREVFADCSARFARWVATLDRPGVPASLPGTSLGVRVRGRDCEGTDAVVAGGCIVSLELTHRGREPFAIPAGAELHPDWQLAVFDASGRRMAVRREGPWPDAIAARPPATVALVTGASQPVAGFAGSDIGAATAGGTAALLQLRERDRDGTVWLRLSP